LLSSCASAPVVPSGVRSELAPTGKLRAAINYGNPVLAQRSMVSVRWTGAAGLEFTYEGKTWLIDPYLSRVGKATVFFGRPQADREKISRYLETLPGKLQAVIVGHTHLDHALV
jgi:glyoxylase-like metal-dependent hydrolase (beta-lactamase superfamily II)